MLAAGVLAAGALATGALAAGALAAGTLAAGALAAGALALATPCCPACFSRFSRFPPGLSLPVFARIGVTMEALVPAARGRRCRGVSDGWPKAAAARRKRRSSLLFCLPCSTIRYRILV